MGVKEVGLAQKRTNVQKSVLGADLKKNGKITKGNMGLAVFEFTCLSTHSLTPLPDTHKRKGGGTIE